MLQTTIASSVLIAVVILLRGLFASKIDLRLQYAIWLLVATRLLMPLPLPKSPVSVLNAVSVAKLAQRFENPSQLSQTAPVKGTNLAIAEDPTGVTGDVGASYVATVKDETITTDIARGKKTSDDVLHTGWLSGAIAIGFWFVAQNIWFYARLRKTRNKVKVPGCRLPVFMSCQVKSPCLFGIRPAIYINTGCSDDNQTLKYILAHEETHYLHGDHLWSYLRCICLALHWFNPLVWWAAVLSRRDCEMACDESTLNRIGDEHRRHYGNTLIDMIELRTSPADLLLSATTMTASRSSMKERIVMIANKPKMLLSTLCLVVLLLAGAVGCTFTGAKEQERIINYPSPVGSEEWGSTFTGFTSNKEGWFVGSPGVALGTSHNYVYLTHDGGKTWKETGNVNDEWSRVLTCAAFSDNKTGYLCFRYDIENLCPVYQTTDGGLSWNRLKMPELAALAEGGVGEVRLIEFGQNSHGKMEFYYRHSDADEGTILTLVSADRGHTWQSTGEQRKVIGQAGSDLFPRSSGNIHDYIPRLLAGRTVSDYDLLPCFEHFTRSSWGELERTYGGASQTGEHWFSVLWTALRDAAISEEREPVDQLLRDYYIGKAYLTSDGAYSEGLADIVLLQWNDNSALYSTCLNQHLSDDEAARLRLCIVYSLMYWDSSQFGLVTPSSGKSISLAAYPVDFPFGHDLIEKGRETYRAESFGQVTAVECDGLQVIYLNPSNGSDGVYTVITLRASRQHYSALGVAIGDSEEFLLAHYPNKLKKVDRISYDDEAWFGTGYDHAYAHTPEEGTKSVVFVIKDSLVTGIEIVNGLDGPMY